MDPLAPIAYTRMPTNLSRSVPGGPGLRTMFQITIPLNDIPPPFKDTEVNKSFDLLQSTAGCRDGVRVATPERAQVLTMAAGIEKHRLRRQQQLLLDIAQRCKEQDIASLSGALSRKCPLSSFEDKYHKDMKEYSTNTILFKTWGNPIDSHLENEYLHQEVHASPRISFERGNTYFPARRIKKLPPKELYMSKPTPKPQVGYSKGLQIKEPFDVDKRKALIAERKINGPIQLDLYSSPKNDQLQPLILPSIKYVGVEIDKVDSYINSKKMKMAHASERGMMPLKAITDGYEQMNQGPGRIIIHTKRPDMSQTDMSKQESTPRHGQTAPPPTVRSKMLEEDASAVAMLARNEPLAEESNGPVIPTE